MLLWKIFTLILNSWVRFWLDKEKMIIWREFNKKLNKVISAIQRLRLRILDKVHRSNYSIHLGISKMYHGLKKFYWWHGMKRDMVRYAKRCLTCKRDKLEPWVSGRASTITISSMEMGTHHNGFYDQVVERIMRTWCDLGCCLPADEIQI